MNKCHVIEEKRKFPTALETNWNWFSNPRQLNTLLDPALKSGRFMSFTVSNLPSSKRVLWRIFVPLFSSSFPFLTSRYSCLGAVLSFVPTLTNLSLSLCHQHHGVPGLWWFCIVTVWHYASSAYNFVEILLRQVVRLKPHDKTIFVFLWSLESPHFPFPMQILKKASVKLGPILLKQHIAASWISAVFFPDLLNKTCKLREPCDKCLDHGREASLGNLLVTRLFLQGVNET